MERSHKAPTSIYIICKLMSAVIRTVLDRSEIEIEFELELELGMEMEMDTEERKASQIWATAWVILMRKPGTRCVGLSQMHRV